MSSYRSIKTLNFDIELNDIDTTNKDEVFKLVKKYKMMKVYIEYIVYI
jgi:hypothetical protein